MSDPRAHQDNARQDRSTERLAVDSRMLARAVEINEAIAAEFAAATDDPRDNPAVRRLEELGFATETIVREVAGRAKQIFFYMRHGRDARSADELECELRRLTEGERAELLAISVAWWDGVLTGLQVQLTTDRARLNPDSVAPARLGVYREFVQKPGVGTRDEGERRLPRCMDRGNDGLATASPQKRERVVASVDERGCRWAWQATGVASAAPGARRTPQRSSCAGLEDVVLLKLTMKRAG